jgi:hypothetical protein
LVYTTADRTNLSDRPPTVYGSHTSETEQREAIAEKIRKYKSAAQEQEDKFFRHGERWNGASLVLVTTATASAAVGAATGLLGENSIVAGAFALGAAIASGLLVPAQRKAKRGYGINVTAAQVKQYADDVLDTRVPYDDALTTAHDELGTVREKYFALLDTMARTHD